MHINRKPCSSFLMVNIAGGLDPGRLRPTTTTTTHNIAAILQLTPSHAALDRIYLSYWASIGWSVDTCQCRRGSRYRGSMFRAQLGQMCLKVFRLPSTDFWTASRARVR